MSADTPPTTPHPGLHPNAAPSNSAQTDSTAEGTTPGGRDEADHPLLTAAVVAAGASVAVLAGRGASPVWMLARVVVVAGVAVGAIVLLRRSRSRWVGAAVAGLGTVALAIGLGFLPHLAKGGLSGTSVASVVAVVAGIGTLVGGSVLLLRGTRLVVRVAAGLGVAVAAVVTSMIIVPSVLSTNVPQIAVGDTPEAVGLGYESVSFTTDDGVRLAGWYVPSQNGAAVVLRHGAGSTRSNVLPEAAVLAGNGFGVLLLDARGHGDSEGRAMDFGWHGDADIGAATAWLATRDDVDPGRIGLVGMSMGGEEAIGAAGADGLVRAVVAEGATARTAADKDWLSTDYGMRGQVQEWIEGVQYGLTDLLTEAAPPTALRAAVEASGDTRFLLVAAGEMPDEQDAAAHIAAGAPDRVEVWTVPGAGHTGGLATEPHEWEQRVVAFLEANLA